MTYYIFTKTTYDIVFNDSTCRYEVTKNKEYYINRKGRIFGFFHKVGDVYEDIEGNTCMDLKYFNTLDEATSYAYAWHLSRYGEDKKIDIRLGN